jgi:transposase
LEPVEKFPTTRHLDNVFVVFSCMRGDDLHLADLRLQIFCSVRSERMLLEQLDYNLLFRWFVGLEMDESVCTHAVFNKNRERLLNEKVALSFFARMCNLVRG